MFKGLAPQVTGSITMVDPGLAALLVFTIAVAAIIARVVDEAALALLAVVVMVAVTTYTPEEAFHYVDWNVIAILFGMWVITGYMIEGGVAERVVAWISRVAPDYRRLLLLLAMAAGFTSILVDNVLVILLFGRIALEAARKARGDPVLAVLLIGFSSNFMGTALLMGDLPPQLLHSVAGAEFMDFIVFRGKPSSFPLLTITFLATLGVYYLLFIRREPGTRLEAGVESGEDRGWDPLLLPLSTLFFAATVVGMALRPMLGVPLGFIPVAGAAALAVTSEALARAGRRLPGFEHALGHVEWRALLFYASLFSLVGGLEATGILREAAERLAPLMARPGVEGYTAAYWLVALPSMIVEHDALLLTFLYIVRDMASTTGIDPWPLYWAMAWSATLGSNATTAAAPALYVALSIAEEGGVRITPGRFLRYSLSFTIPSLVIHYLVTLPFWGTG